MKQLLILLKLSFKFTKRYILQYLLELKKPLIVAFIGFLLFLTCFIHPALALVALLSIPCFCYAFWKGYLITYALIPCADNFIKENPEPFKNFVNNIKLQEGNIAKFVCFIAFFTIVLYIPSFIYAAAKISFLPDLQQYLKLMDNAFLINTLILAPFLNYALCALYYKKDKENYFNLFLNCYKKLNVLGILIALVLTLFSYKFVVVYIILALFLNPFIYSINTLWYFSRPKTDK